MNDDNAETHDLNAIAAFPHGTGYVLSLMDETGELHTFTLSGQRLRQVATVIVNCVQGVPSGSSAIIDQFGK